MIAGKDTANGSASALTERVRLFGEPRQQRPPRRIGERGKGAIEWAAIILNHIVKHSPEPLAVKRYRLRGFGPPSLVASLLLR